MCLLAGNAQLLTQSEIALSVNNAEVYRFRTPAHIGIHGIVFHIEYLHRRFCMNINAMVKGIDHHLFIRHMCQHTQLNLGIIRRQQHMSLTGDKRLANLLSLLIPHGNILQVWFRGGQAAGLCLNLIENRMNLTIL